MQCILTVLSVMAISLLSASIFISVKSKTGKNKPQTYCLWLGEIFLIVVILIALRTIF